MRKPFSQTISVIALTGMLGACSPAASPETSAPPDTSAEDMAAVNALRDSWQTAFNAGDAPGLVALYTDDAAIMNPGEATVSGRTAIQAYYEGLFSEMTPQTEVRPATTEVEGSLGFDSGTYTGTMTPKAGGEAMTQEGRYLVIVKKGADGAWKVAREFGNLPTAPPMPTTGKPM